MNSPKHQSIDEGMIKFKKRFFARQYMTNKHVKRGLKDESDPAADKRLQRMKAWSCNTECFEYTSYFLQIETLKINLQFVVAEIVIDSCAANNISEHIIY